MGIQIKKFRAPTLQKAIERIRAELGDNAIILQTEPISGMKGLGILGRDTVEVTAGIDRAQMPQRLVIPDEENEKPAKLSIKSWLPSKKIEEAKTQVAIPPASPAPSSVAKTHPKPEAPPENAPALNQMYAMKAFLEPLQKEVEGLKKQIKTLETAPKSKFKDPLEKEVFELREELKTFLTERRFQSLEMPEYLKRVIQFWNEKGTSQKEVLSFLKRLEQEGLEFQKSESDTAAQQLLMQGLERHIQDAARLMRKTSRIVVLVGPTGVGKTTTIAKLAAHERLKLQRSVALLTLDDYKIGGSDQLAHYARIMDVPYARVRGDMSLEEQIQLLDADTIFIDTYGVSPKDQGRMESLKQALRFRDPQLRARVEIHLALPVGIASPSVPKTLSFFSHLNPNFLMFTKWDETESWGGMLTTILESEKPVSYVSNGQSVPDDIFVFSKQNFISELVPGRDS